MSDISVPDDIDEWPFKAKATHISELNTAADIREEIDNILGLDDPQWKQSDSDSDAGRFRKYELAVVLLALGGPQ